MAKFKLASWLSAHSSDSSDVEKKKQNRRSFSAFSIRSNAGKRTAKTARDDGIILEAAITPSSSDMTGGDLAAGPNSSTAPPSQLAMLAQRITDETAKLDTYMQAHSLKVPGFDASSPSDFPALPEEVQASRRALFEAAKELEMLAHGPRESMRWGIWAILDVLALAALVHYDIAKLWPVGETIPLAELQARTRLDPINLARFLRLAMTHRIFAEPQPGIIAHTAASRVLAEDDDLLAWLGFNGEDIFPAASHVLQALETHPEAVHLTQTGFNFAFDTVDQEPMFQTFGKDPARAKRMGRAMASLTGGEGYEVSYLVDIAGGGYDFTEVDQAGGTFVDVGGSHGFVCTALGERYKNMKFVVQDLPKTVESAPKPICEDEQVAERISFQAHDFFSEQPLKGADVYFFRWIIHNYSTPYAVKIIKSLIPALKPGARILINDHCLREPGQENPWDETIMRQMDMVMLALLNAQERTEAEFRELFRLAGDGFVFKGVTRPKGCRMSIVEAVWQPSSAEEADKTAKEGQTKDEANSHSSMV